MSGRYSPIYSGVWSDDALEGAPFEEKAFFVFLWSNDRIRPSGIYRVTDDQIRADTGLRLRTLRAYLADLGARRRIVRDGAWLFIRGYLNRQPNHKNLLVSARQDVEACTSGVILEAFGDRYPLYFEWSANGLATIGRPLNATRSTVGQPLNENRPQSSTEQYRKNRTKEQGSGQQEGRSRDRGGSAGPEPVAAVLARLTGFQPGPPDA